MGWGSIGSVFEGAANYLGGILGNEYASNKANERYKDTQQWLSLNQPSWTVQGLRDAGLNPMLAVSNGLSSSQAVNTASSYSPRELNFLQRASTAKQLELQDEQLATQRALTLKTNAEAYESYERTWNAQIQRKIAEANLPAIQAEALLKAAQSAFLKEYPLIWQASMIGNSASDALGPVTDMVNSFVDGWLKNKGIDAFGNKQPPIKSKNRVRY